MALQFLRRSQNSCTAVDIVLSCANLGFPKGGAAMPLTMSRPVGPHLSPGWQQLAFRPALRGHHRIRWEILLVKVSSWSYAYTFQPGQADRGGREGLASTVLDISAHHGDPPRPSCVWMARMSRDRGWMR